jgi:hypothetical protein
MCAEKDVLVYEINDILYCAEHYRDVTRQYHRVQSCDFCGSTPAVRDPNHRRNEYLCWKCHEQTGFTVNNTVIKRAIVSMVDRYIHRGPRTKCDAAGYGTACDDNVKPRGQWGGKSLCDTHGKKPPKPNKS